MTSANVVPIQFYDKENDVTIKRKKKKRNHTHTHTHTHKKKKKKKKKKQKKMHRAGFEPGTSRSPVLHLTTGLLHRLWNHR